MNSYHLQIAEFAKTLFESGFVVLDLETTSLAKDPQVSIVEIGILSHQGEVLLDTRVKPTRSIEPGAMAVHGITDADVKDAPPFDKVYPLLAERLKDQTVVVYNVEFDREVLSKVCRRAKLALPTVAEWYCAMRNYADLRGSGNWFKLETACRHEHIPVQGAHSALGDCRLTLALMGKMAEKAQ
jgi:DNA polymerase-3 subunit epsilon